MVYWVIEKQAHNENKGETSCRRIGPFQSRKEAEQACQQNGKSLTDDGKSNRTIVCDFA